MRAHFLLTLISPWGMDQWGSTLRRCHFTARQKRGAGQVQDHLQMKWINIRDEVAIAIIFLFFHERFCSVLEIQDTSLTASDNRIISTLDLCCLPHDLWNYGISVMFTVVKGCYFLRKFLKSFSPSPFTFSLVLKLKTQRHGKWFWTHESLIPIEAQFYL